MLQLCVDPQKRQTKAHKSMLYLVESVINITQDQVLTGGYMAKIPKPLSTARQWN